MLAFPTTPERSSREIETELVSEPNTKRTAELLRELLETYESEPSERDEDET